MLASAVFVLYGRTVRLWWTFDDLFHAHFLLTHSPLGYRFSPEVWGRLPFRMFTPLQFLSYHADLALFGLQPERFYVHQLLALALMTRADTPSFSTGELRRCPWHAATGTERGRLS